MHTAGLQELAPLRERVPNVLGDARDLCGLELLVARVGLGQAHVVVDGNQGYRGRYKVERRLEAISLRDEPPQRRPYCRPCRSATDDMGIELVDARETCRVGPKNSQQEQHVGEE
jgi:hypothetical protein